MDATLKQNEKSGIVQLVTFSINNEEYGVNVSDVFEIIRLPKIQRLPKAPEFIKGIISLRGEVVPVVDLRNRFNLKEEEDNQFKRTLIVKIDNQKIGMIVDKVYKVLRFPVAEIKDPPNFTASIGSEYINGVIILEDRMIILLNLGLIFSKHEISELDKTYKADSLQVESA